MHDNQNSSTRGYAQIVHGSRWRDGVLRKVTRSLLAVGILMAATPSALAFASSRLPVTAIDHGTVAPFSVTSPTASLSLGLLCAQLPTAASNVLTSCDQPQAPHNETAIAINPRNPLNMIASANDYQETSPTSRTLLSRAHVSFDGGRSWANYSLPYPPECTFTGDPSVAFDATGTVY